MIPNLRCMHQHKIMLTITVSKLSYMFLVVTMSPTCQSVWFYDQLFHATDQVWHKWTEWPKVILKYQGPKYLSYMKYLPPRPQLLSIFALQLSSSKIFVNIHFVIVYNVKFHPLKINIPINTFCMHCPWEASTKDLAGRKL